MLDAASARRSAWPPRAGLELRRGDAPARRRGRRRRRRSAATPIRGLVAACVAGPWLAETLAGLRRPKGSARVDPGRDLRGTLRPYQQVGVRWLHLCSELGLGACLADDMGLGKTIQVLALLLVRRKRRRAGRRRRPSLLVAPASLLANWAAEIERFAPSLKALVAHPSAMPAERAAGDSDAGDASRRRPRDHELRLAAAASPWLATTAWDLVVLDEAQAIKNPGAKQTRAVKQLAARARIALTGTPVENRLGDLWSIFDFLNPGLLGSAKEFTAFTKRLAPSAASTRTARCASWCGPTSCAGSRPTATVIADLPDKTEVKAYCPLSRKQAALYQQAVEELRRAARGRRGHRSARASSSRS